MDRVDVLLIGHDVVLVLALGDVRQHRGILGLSERQLVMDKIPNRFTCGLIAGDDLFLGQLAPGTSAGDPRNLYGWNSMLCHLAASRLNAQLDHLRCLSR